MRGTVRALVVAFLGLGILAGFGTVREAAAKRVALVVGNAAYTHAAPLVNPVNDARAIAGALERLGFDLGGGPLLDAELFELWDAVRIFGRRSREAELAVLYYAGHAIQIDEVNRLIPVDGALKLWQDVSGETVELDVLKDNMRADINILILDACRDNPFVDQLQAAFGGPAPARSMAGLDRGLKRVEPGALDRGMLIAMAAGPGATAADGDRDGHSPYAAALLKYLEQPDLPLGLMFRHVREEVAWVTHGAQQPEVIDRLPARAIILKDSKPAVGSLASVATRSLAWNEPPTAEDDRIYVPPGGRRTVAVLENDRDPDGDPLLVVMVGPPAFGIAYPTRDRQGVVYEAPEPFRATDRFIYTVVDSGGFQASAAVTVSREGTDVPAPGSAFRDCAECPEMVMLPRGSYLMGSPPGEAGRDNDEGPQHRVTIGYDFAVGKYEVTNGEFAAFLNSVGRRGGPGTPWIETTQEDKYSLLHVANGRFGVEIGADRRPVVNVSWYGARAYAAWLEEKTGKPYRLLSEAEWEYAARAGTTSRFWWGDEAARDHANHFGSAGADRWSQTAPVGSFPPNPFGLHDTSGNVWEWVGDCYRETYRNAPADGAVWVSGFCEHRVLRGGSWSRSPRDVRSAFRSREEPGARHYDGGFRVALTFEEAG